VIRFRTGHEKDLDYYLENTRLCNAIEETMGSLVKDKLQSSETVSTVWFGGPIPEDETRELIEDIILESDIFQQHNITNFELQIIPIRTKKGPVPTDNKRIKAVHAICTKEDSDKV
jgi:hypothetical protein